MSDSRLERAFAWRYKDMKGHDQHIYSFPSVWMWFTWMGSSDLLGEVMKQEIWAEPLILLSYNGNDNHYLMITMIDLESESKIGQGQRSQM